MEYPRLGILVLNHNGRRWLAPLFASIQANRYPDVRIYLVDNASGDGSVEMTRAEHPEVTVLRMPDNLGYCAAYNLAMPHALADGCEWLVWSNNDVLLEPGCLESLVRAGTEHQDIGVVGPAFLAWEGDGPNSYMLGNHPQAIPAMHGRSAVPIDVAWVEGSFLMLSRRCAERVGGLDPYLFAYWEEADFCRRARHQGYRVVLVPNALARHYGGASWGSEPQRCLRRRLMARNHYIFKLANPEQSFARNILNACHLFGVCVKQASPSAAAVLEELRVFGTVLRSIPAIRGKWTDDRAGRPPSSAPAWREPVSVERLPGSDGFRKTLADCDDHRAGQEAVESLQKGFSQSLAG